MARKLKTDPVLFMATLLLVCGGLVMVYSASAPMAFSNNEDPSQYLTKQLMWVALGTALLGLAMRFNYHNYSQPPLVFALLAAASIALFAVLFAPPVKGSSRWFNLGGLSVQPSEFAKLVVVLYVAMVLERVVGRGGDLRRALVPLGAVVGVIVILVLLEPDFGTAIVIAAIAAVMVFAAGLPYRYVIGAVLAFAPVAAVVGWLAPYRRARVTAFLDPWADPLDSGYQIIQSLIAVGTGGLTGRGLGAGVQKMDFLTEAHNDFIYAVVAEELGLAGAGLILVCFAVVIWRGLRASARAPDGFGALLALGLTVMISMQALINISVVLGLLPPKGFPLPFVSAGGSSLLMSMLGMGILLNVSQHEAG
ncbi:MAG: putative lipid II flippase FtsW [Vicinamibacterales bacterium]